MLWCGKRAEQEPIRGRGSGEKQPVGVHCLGAQPLVTGQGLEADGVLVLEHLRSPGLELVEVADLTEPRCPEGGDFLMLLF